eukprot:2595290-Pyramimonas_sp.AAC.1
MVTQEGTWSAAAENVELVVDLNATDTGKKDRSRQARSHCDGCPLHCPHTHDPLWCRGGC